MFTGIITNIATVESVSKIKNKDLLLELSCDKNQIKSKMELGCSIACNGICLTLIKKVVSGKKVNLSFQSSLETCNKTTIHSWTDGQKINLEFALRVGDELGGHMVLGHVDSTTKIKSICKVKDSHKFTFATPKSLKKFIVEKGSVVIDGVSLTVNKVEKDSFNINVIEHTLRNTTFSNNKVGDSVNLEIDVIARYCANL